MPASSAKPLRHASSPAQTNAIRLVFFTSESCGLLRFISCIDGRTHTTDWIKEWYQTQPHSPEQHRVEEKKLLDQYHSLMDCSESEFKDEIGRPLNLEQKLFCMASEYRDAASFLNAVKRTVPASEFSVIKATFEYFAPIYHRLVWVPNLRTLQRQSAEFRNGALKTKMSAKLQQVQHFMGSSWPSGLPFVIVLVPLPPSKHTNSTGESLGHLQTVELCSFHCFRDRADVVFHEACHALWRTSKNRDRMRNDFDQSGGTVAYDELNEAMATALGQGWYPEMAFGRHFSGGKGWYRDSVIDSYSHALYPLLRQYLSSNETIDASFADHATTIFRKMFPDCDTDTSLTNSLEIYAENIPNVSEFLSHVRERLLPRLSDLGVWQHLDDQKTYKNFNVNESTRTLFLLSAADVGKLTHFGIGPERIALLQSKSGAPVVVRMGKRILWFIIADTPLQQQQLLDKTLATGKWPQVSEAGPPTHI